MKVKCVLCEVIDTIDDDSPLAKKLRNRPIHTYMCDTCYERIKQKTLARKETINFKLYESRDKGDKYIQ